MTGKEISLSVKWLSEYGRREVLQDSIGWSDVRKYPARGFLAVLSDGMGGMKNGEVYSDIAVNEMVDSFRESGAGEDIVITLLECYARARRVALAKCPDPKAPDGGATVVAVCIRNGLCAFLSVGDSRLYLWRGGGLIQLNREQTLGGLLDENAALGYIPREYTKSVLRGTIENNLCEPEFKRCDIPASPFALVDGDRLLLMSDGISHALTDAELTDVISGAEQDIVEAIGDAVIGKKKPKQDNYTILEIRIKAGSPVEETEDRL